jgi:apolipoprotein D and lipocalin family protein
MIKEILIVAAILLFTAVLAAKTETPLKPVTTVDKVELNKYLGLWHQIAYFPVRFQPIDYPRVTAEYSLDGKGRINVLNKCYKDANGITKMKKAKGKAYAADASNSKLKVTFFWPFYADYWIVKLDKVNYSYSVVSDPSRKYLWILSRTPYMDRKTYDGIINFLTSNGWDLGRLEVTAEIK